MSLIPLWASEVEVWGKLRGLGAVDIVRASEVVGRPGVAVRDDLRELTHRRLVRRVTDETWEVV